MAARSWSRDGESKEYTAIISSVLIKMDRRKGEAIPKRRRKMSGTYSDFLYVLWVKTGREEIALKQIKNSFGEEVVPLELLVETFFRTQGKVIKLTKLAFPGYIFLTSEIENDEFIFRARECACQSLSILKPLRYIGTFRAAMWEDERAAIDYLWQDKNCIETSTGFFEGDHVVVMNGPLKGRESIIKEIHPRKRQAIVEIEMMGRLISITIGLEIIEKLS